MRKTVCALALVVALGPAARGGLGDVADGDYYMQGDVESVARVAGTRESLEGVSVATFTQSGEAFVFDAGEGTPLAGAWRRQPRRRWRGKMDEASLLALARLLGDDLADGVVVDLSPGARRLRSRVTLSSDRLDNLRLRFTIRIRFRVYDPSGRGHRMRVRVRYDGTAGR